MAGRDLVQRLPEPIERLLIGARLLGLAAQLGFGLGQPIGRPRRRRACRPRGSAGCPGRRAGRRRCGPVAAAERRAAAGLRGCSGFGAAAGVGVAAGAGSSWASGDGSGERGSRFRPSGPVSSSAPAARNPKMAVSARSRPSRGPPRQFSCAQAAASAGGHDLRPGDQLVRVLGDDLHGGAQLLRELQAPIDDPGGGHGGRVEERARSAGERPAAPAAARRTRAAGSGSARAQPTTATASVTRKPSIRPRVTTTPARSSQRR